MNTITLIKTDKGHLAPADRYAVDALSKVGDGEYLIGVLRQPRNLPFHRKAFAMLQFAFDQWNPEGKAIAGMPAQKSFDNFRKELTIEAGYYQVVLGLDGEPRLEAKSLAFDKMGEKEFEECYEAIVTVLRNGILAGMSKEDAERVARAVEDEGF